MISARSNNDNSNSIGRPPASDTGSVSRPAVSPPRGGVGDDVDDVSVARAAAEVSVMGGGTTRARPPGAEAAAAAIQGTSGGDGGEASSFEVVDEGGELVRVRFHEFLVN